MKQSFSTSDLVLGASLCASDHKFISVNHTDKRCEFVFEKEQNTDEIVKKFKQSQLQVEPQLFCVFLRFLKGKIFSIKK